MLYMRDFRGFRGIGSPVDKRYAILLTATDASAARRDAAPVKVSHRNDDPDRRQVAASVRRQLTAWSQRKRKRFGPPTGYSVGPPTAHSVVSRRCGPRAEWPSGSESRIKHFLLVPRHGSIPALPARPAAGGAPLHVTTQFPSRRHAGIVIQSADRLPRGHSVPVQ